MGEIILTKRKEMDLFTYDGLTKQTGTHFSSWDMYILKELIDNAIDICESANVETPSIGIIILPNGITIRDNGPGMSRETIDKIVNLNIYAGSKYYYKRPTRGAQGNALLTILPMPYVLSGGEVTQCATIRSGTKQFSIFVEHDNIQQDYSFKVDESDLPEEIKGTEISIKVFLRDIHELKTNEIPHPSHYISLINSFAVFNPHCEFVAEIYKEKTIHNKKGKIKKMKSESESVHWYSYNAFRDLIYAYLRAGQGSITIKNFCMSRFRGIGNSTKNEVLLKPMASRKLEDLKINETDIKQMYSNLKEICRILSPSVLGEIGKEQLQSFFGSDVHGTKYKKEEGNLETDDGYRIPYVLEGLATQSNGSTSSKLYTGLNNSPMFSNNSIARLLDHGELRVSDNAGILTALHLTCPNVSFSNYSKAEFDLTSFMPVIKKVLKGILGDYYESRDRAEKERQRTQKKERKEREEKEKQEKRKQKAEKNQKKQTIKEIFYQTFDEAYNRTTVNGKYEADIRQGFYKQRPMVEALINGKLNYDYFSNLVEGVEKARGKRLYNRETRGELVHPRSTARLQINTRFANTYVPPPHEYNKILYIEKRGFLDVLIQNDIHSRYDIGLMGGQGFLTEDIKKVIIDVVGKSKGEITAYCLHDCDISGIHILNAARKEHYTEGTKVDIIDMGILPREAMEKGYPVEPNPSEKSYNYEKVKDAISYEEFKWLTDGEGKRVELNIFSPPEFVDYVRDKLEEFGITGKVLPPVDVIEESVSTTVKLRKNLLISDAINKSLTDINRLLDELRFMMVNNDAIWKALEKDFDDRVGIDSSVVRENVKKNLDHNPIDSWRYFVNSHVERTINNINGWDEHVKEVVEANIDSKIRTLLKSVIEEISKNRDFAKSSEGV